MRKHALPAALAAVLGCLPLVASAEQAASPRMLGQNCEGCHGPGGKSQGAIPSLRGLPQEYIVSAMKAFKSGSRDATIMGRHAKGYTDEQIELIAQYFGSQTSGRPE
jgi:sulfide dehydrogenase cytochrome subunit